MHTLPTAMVQLLAPFALLFSERVWRHAQVLLAGTILAPGKQTVGAALRVMGLGRIDQYQRYHRVLNRAVWSSREASRVLLGLLVKTFLPKGEPLVVPVRLLPFRHPHVAGPPRASDDLHRPPQSLLHPVFALALAVVTRVQPQVRESREPLLNPLQKQLYAIPVHNARGVNLRFQHQPLGVHQQVAFAALELLSAIITAIFTADSRGLTDCESTMPALG